MKPKSLSSLKNIIRVFATSLEETNSISYGRCSSTTENCNVCERTLKLHDDNVKKLTSTIDPKCQNYPTAFLTVMGQPSSDTSFYTNLLLNHFKRGRSGSLRKFSEARFIETGESQYLPGFSNGNNKSTETFTAPETEPNGIFAWHKPFRIENYYGKINLLVLHMPQNNSCTQNPTEQSILIHLLHLLCSRTIVVASDLKEIKTYDFQNNGSHNASVQFQKSVMYMFRNSTGVFRFYNSNNNENNLGDTKFAKEFDDLLNTAFLDNYKTTSAVYVPKFKNSLHDSKGCLLLNETSYNQLDQVLEVMGNTTHIQPNTFMKKQLELCSIFQYVAHCVDIVNQTALMAARDEAPNSLLGRKSLPTNFIRDKTKALRKKRSLSGNANNQQDTVEKRNLSLLLEKAYDDLQLSMQQKFCTLFTKCVGTESERFIDTLLSQSMNEILQNLASHQKLPNTHSNQLQESLNFRCQALKASYIQGHNILARNHAEIENGIRCLLSSPEGHHQFSQVEAEITTQNRGLQSNDLAFKACNQLQITFLEHLVRVRRNENNLIKSTIGLLADEYNDCMDTLVSKHHTNPKYLQKLHLELSHKLLSLFCYVHYSEVNSINRQNPFLLEVEKYISSGYKTYKDANTTKLKSMFEIINRLIDKQKKYYCEKMDQSLQLNPEASYLQKIHETYLEKSIAGLESDVASRIGSGEPSKVHVATLNTHISKYWINYQSKIDPNKKKSEKGNMHFDQQSSAQIPGSVPSTKLVQPPLIFQLCLTQVVAAVPTENSIQILHKEELQFAITSTGSWLCGNAVLVDSSNQKYLHTENIWEREKFCWLNPTAKNHYDKNVTPESILGYHLSILKHKVNAELAGAITKCLVIVPFWFPSPQRQQVIDAGKIAGFVEVGLINENTAIALYAAEQERIQNRSSEIFVISENSNRVDATVYSIDKKTGGIRMKGHCGTYNVSRKTGNDLQLVKDVCDSAYSQSDPDSRNSLKKLTWRSRSQKINKKVSYISYQCAAWEEFLYEAQTHLNRVVTDGEKGDWGKKLALLGALYFYYHPVKICHEWISAPVFLRVKTKDFPLFLKGTDLPAFGQIRKISGSLPKKSKELQIYQTFAKTNWQWVGSFWFGSKSKSVCQFNLQIDHQGIITFLRTDHDHFRWVSDNLNESGLASAKKAVETLSRLPVENEYVYELLGKLKDFLDQIGVGDTRFRSETIRSQVTGQVMEWIEILSGSTTPEVVKHISGAYETLRKKYTKKSRYAII